MWHAILALRDLIQDHQVIVVVINAVLLPIYGYKLWRALFASPGRNRASSSSLRRPPPKPVVRPPVVAGVVKPPEPPRSTSDQGVSGYQRAGAAKTVKLPSAAPKGDSAPGAPPTPAPGERIEVKTGPGHDTTAIKLPSQGEVPATSAPVSPGAPVAESKTGLIRKATRMEELGFHPGTNPAADGAPAAAATPPGAPGASDIPRSQTAELTSILERIDKFLAEDQPAATPATAATTPAPAAPAKAEEPPREASAAPSTAAPGGETALAKKAPPLWARPDAQDEDVEPPPGAAPKVAERANERPTEKPLDAGAKPADGGDKPADGGQQRLF
jgi:hypothetical protein